MCKAGVALVALLAVAQSVAAQVVASKPVDLSKDFASYYGNTKEPSYCLAGASAKIDGKTGAVTIAATGVAGKQSPKGKACGINDYFAVGASAGYGITKTLIAALVTKGAAKWTDTIGSILDRYEARPPGMKQGYAKVTLKDLVQGKSGIVGFENFWWGQQATFQADLVKAMRRKAVSGDGRTQLRAAYSEALLSVAPDLGYANTAAAQDGTGIVLSWLVEILTGGDYERVVDDALLKPLGISAVFPSINGSAFKGATKGVLCVESSGGPYASWEVMPDDFVLSSPFYAGIGGVMMRVTDLVALISWHTRHALGLLPPAAYTVISKAAYAVVSDSIWTPTTKPAVGYARFDTTQEVQDVNFTHAWSDLYHYDSMGFQNFLYGVAQKDAGGNYLALATATNAGYGVTQDRLTCGYQMHDSQMDAASRMLKLAYPKLSITRDLYLLN